MTFMCSSCGYLSDRKDNMIKHINRKKSCGENVQGFVRISSDIHCEYCLKKFASKQNLTYHVKHVCKKPLLEKRKITPFIRNNYEETLINIPDTYYNKLLLSNEAYHIIPILIKYIHFDPNNPSNHNIYISNKNNKYIHIYKYNHWENSEKNAEIDRIIKDKNTLLGNWVKENGDKYPRAVKKYNDYKDQLYDEDTMRIIKEQIELLLYNGKYITRDN